MPPAWRQSWSWFCFCCSISLKHGPALRNRPTNSLLSTSVKMIWADKLLLWLQGTVEGGFMGRTNKLVDGCYSFWQGGLFPLLQRLGPQLLSQSGIPMVPHPTSIPSEHTSSGTGSESTGQREQQNSSRAGDRLEDSSISQPIVVPSFPLRQPVSLQGQAAAATQQAKVICNP